IPIHRFAGHQLPNPVLYHPIPLTIPFLASKCQSLGLTLATERIYYGIVILTISPRLGGPNPQFETYRFPSGPKVIPVGRESPEAISSTLPEWFTRRTFPVPGVGKRWAPVVFSRT